MSKVNLPIVPDRNCGACTKCCEGYLQSTILGHTMHQGKPCFFLEKSCSIYANRPQDPCRDYSCAWVEEDIFPMWMKPNISNLIITKKIPIEGEHLAYYEATEAGSKMDSSVLNWLIHWAMGNSINLVYQIDGKQHIMGKPDFMQHRKI